MAINIENKMEVFWDDYIVDTEKTTAFHRVLNPVRKDGICFNFDKGWEKDYTCGYPCIVKDGKNYKMYYDYQNFEEIYHPKQALAVLESDDGIHWTRPDLDIYPHPELEGCNNIVLEPIGDGYYVFVDETPACPADEKYKAVGAVWRYNEEKGKDEPKLYCFASPDGYHFKEICTLREDSLFDSMNVILWRNNRYECYFRNFHQAITREGVVRDIRVMYSDDFFVVQQDMADSSVSTDLSLRRFVKQLLLRTQTRTPTLLKSRIISRRLLLWKKKASIRQLTQVLVFLMK